MPPPPLRALARTGLAALCLPAAFHIAALARVIASRFACPLDLEYLEGAHVYHAWRLSHGLGLYGDPSRGFATFPYPPLFWVAIQAAAACLGFNDQAGRAVSILSMIGILAVLGWVVLRSAPSRGLGVAMAVTALAGSCAGYAYCGGSYDLTRPDTMSMLLVILAAAIARDGLMPAPRAWATAVALAASVYTKQTGLVFAFWLIAFAFWRDWRGGLRLAWMTGLLCAATFFALEVLTRGWFGRWVAYPGRQPLFPERLGSAMVILLWHAPFLPFLPVLVWWLWRRGALRPTTALWAGMLGAGVLASLLAGIKDLAWLNVWMPGVLLSWPVAFALIGDSLHRPLDQGPRRAISWGALACGSVLLVCIRHDLSSFVPGHDRWEASERLDAIVRGLSGGVVVTTAPMVAVSAGNTLQQPILATYEDARNGGMRVDYVDALVGSGARWVITTDRYKGPRAPEARMARAFEREKTFDFDVHSLAEWDHAANVVLWHKIGE